MLANTPLVIGHKIENLSKPFRRNTGRRQGYFTFFDAYTLEQGTSCRYILSQIGQFLMPNYPRNNFHLILGGSHFFHNVAHEFYQRAKTIEFSSQYFGLCLYLPQLARVLIKAFLPKSRHCVTNLAKHLLISFPLRCTRGTPELSPCSITTLCKLDGPQAGSSAGSRALLQASCKVPVHLGSVR